MAIQPKTILDRGALRSGPKALSECAEVASLVERSRRLVALDRRLRKLLPDTLQPHCQLADVRAGAIVFLASSSTWAARLRLHQTALLTAARVVLGPAIAHLTVRIAPLPPPLPEPEKTKPLSKAAAAHLRSAAKTLADPELKALYLHLASLAES